MCVCGGVGVKEGRERGGGGAWARPQKRRACHGSRCEAGRHAWLRARARLQRGSTRQKLRFVHISRRTGMASRRRLQALRALAVLRRRASCPLLSVHSRARISLLDASLLDELADALLEIVDARAHLVDAADDRVRHGLEASLLRKAGMGRGRAQAAQKAIRQRRHMSPAQGRPEARTPSARATLCRAHACA